MSRPTSHHPSLRPVVIHPRNDFLVLALDQLANHAAKWSLMFGHQSSVPLAVRTVACRGWGSAAQHSQALHAMLAVSPGLEISLPFAPADAKGVLLYAALESPGPVVVMEHKWLWNLRGHVEAGRTIVPPGPPRVLREGGDLSIVGLSYGAADALCAAETLARQHGVEAEVLDLRWLRPLDVSPVCRSVAKTGRLMVVDTGHRLFGASGEIITQVLEYLGPAAMKAAPVRVGVPDSPVPACCERNYFPGPDDVVAAALRLQAIPAGGAST